MKDKATPTITLAELYESQNQYIDALVIYKNLYKENPKEKLQNKIDELKDKIFKENTLEYSTLIDKIFTEEEKRIFHILPHEQYKTYIESKAEIKFEETYPEELTKVKKEEVAPDETEEPEIEEKTPNINDTVEPETEIKEEESIELENTIEINDTAEELIEDKKDELIPEDDKILEIDEEETPEIEEEELITEKKEEMIPEIEETPEIDKEETPEIKDALEPEEKIDIEETIELDNTLEKDDLIEDDISLEIDENISDDLNEQDSQTEDVTSIEDIMEKKIEGKEIQGKGIKEKEIQGKGIDEQNEIIDTEETIQSENIEVKVEPIVEPQDNNLILELLTELSNMRPDIVERVLKENVGPDASLSEIKLSDLNFVVKLLKVSENVKKD